MFYLAFSQYICIDRERCWSYNVVYKFKIKWYYFLDYPLNYMFVFFFSGEGGGIAVSKQVAVKKI